MNNFILSYNPISCSPSPGQLLNHVQVNRHVAGYYQPFQGTYVIKSELSAAGLTESFKGLFEAEPFVISQVWPHAMGGTLPESIWHWINHGYIQATAGTVLASSNVNNALARALGGSYRNPK